MILTAPKHFGDFGRLFRLRVTSALYQTSKSRISILKVSDSSIPSFYFQKFYTRLTSPFWSCIRGKTRVYREITNVSFQKGESWLFSFHRLFFKSLVSHKFLSTLAANLRRTTAKLQLYRGNSAPFLSLVGISLASGQTTLISKEQEIEYLISDIRQMASRKKTSFYESSNVDFVKDFKLVDFELEDVIAKGCSAVVYSATSKTFERKSYAIKMMFNYYAESNAYTIFRAMDKEILPAQSQNVDGAGEYKEWASEVKEKKLGFHPNIVEMYSAFVDRVPKLRDAIHLYPEALPTRLNPHGYGRNMSLFLVMKRYDCSLKDYLSTHSSLDERLSLVLLTQILEGITHMVHNKVSHRDLKSDNLLLDLTHGDNCPQLVISDFGCSGNLIMPYYSWELDKGGNVSLMAPEVKYASPGPFSTIVYEKADVWAAGAIAYELFGVANPFYVKEKERLPPSLPIVLQNLIGSLLQKDPKNRLSAKEAANICQCLLWAPKLWWKLSHIFQKLSSNDILEWLLICSLQILYRDTQIKAVHETQLLQTFLSRLSMTEIRIAIDWIQNNQE